MKKTCTYLFLLFSTASMSQNLVPNPSFENFSSCPQFLSQINLAIGWQAFKESPDYFNVCANISNPLLGVPSNAWGTEQAFDGNAYIGLISFGKNLQNAREHAGIQLLQPLIPGVQYFVSLWVSRCDTTSENCAINKLGVKFSTVQYTSSIPDSLNNFAHVYTDSIVILNNSWFNIEGSFFADSAYSYLIIGNFFDDANTDTAECSEPLSSFATYYVDGVCVSADSLECLNAFTPVQEITQQPHFNILSDPFANLITIVCPFNRNEVNLYDTSGRLCFKTRVNGTRIQINIKSIPVGMYVLQIINDRQFYSQKILISHL